jgi:hypothetical protein
VGREVADAACESSHHWPRELGLVQIDDILNNVVAKGILDEAPGIFCDATNEPDLLVAVCMIDTPLQDTASMAVCADFNTALANGIKDELGFGRGELVQALLNDVIAIQILDKLNHPVTKSLSDEMNLLRRGNVLNHLLESPGSVLVQGNAGHVSGGILDQARALVVVAELKEFLAQIITKGVHHELRDMLVSLEPDHVDLSGIAFLELLLKIAATVLIFAQLVDLVAEALQRHVLITRHGWKGLVAFRVGDDMHAHLHCPADDGFA